MSFSRRPDDDPRSSKSSRTDSRGDAASAASSAAAYNRGSASSAASSASGHMSEAEKARIRAERSRDAPYTQQQRPSGNSYGNDRWQQQGGGGGGGGGYRGSYRPPGPSSASSAQSRPSGGSSYAPPAKPASGASALAAKAAAAAQAAADAERERKAEAEYQARVESKLAELAEQEEKSEEQLAEERRIRREAILNKYKDQQTTAAAAAAPASAEPAVAVAPSVAPVPSSAAAAASVPNVPSSAAAPAAVSAANGTAATAAATPSAASAVSSSAAPAASASAASAAVPAAAPAAAAAAAAADEYDMFSDSPSALPGVGDDDAMGGAAAAGGSKMGEMLDSYDDHDGYYRYRAGDLLEGGRYRVCGLQGSGVFSTVLRVRELLAGSNGAPSTEGRELVVKLIRNNETMLRAGLKELEYLKILSANDPENRKHCVRLLNHFTHRHHLCLVFEPLSMDLRKVIKKFGSIGLPLAAVRSYAKQMMVALKHLKKCHILHGDIKPDNILVNEQMNVIKLCDFGSAGRLDTGDCTITPYLVSRFYRAPEIMLGAKYDHQVDLWSIGCCLYELYTGRILFSGSDNNSMLKAQQDVKGRFPKRVLKGGAFVHEHFDAEGVFESKKVEASTGKVIVTKVRYTEKPPRDLLHMLRDAPGERLGAKDQVKLRQLADFIHACTALDPAQRGKCEELIKHPFIEME